MSTFRSLRGAFALVSALAPAVALASCGGGSSPDLEEVPAIYVDTTCDLIAECVGPLADLFVGEGQCTDLFLPVVEDGALPLWQTAIDAGTVIYHPGRVNGCLRALRREGCDGLLERTLDECEAIFEGTVGIGGNCTIDIECQGTAICDSELTCPGTCRSRPGLNSACTEDDDCEAGLVCFEDECVPPADLGEDCQVGNPDCALGMICLGVDEDALPPEPGHCEQIDGLFIAENGDDCSLEAGPLCVDGSSCVITDYNVLTQEATYQCVATSQPGGTCRIGLPDVCPSGQFCAGTDFVLLDFEGTCADLPVAGENCAPETFGARCAAGATCIDDECIAPQRNDGTCSEDSDCFSGFCDVTICAAPECV